MTAFRFELEQLRARKKDITPKPSLTPGGKLERDVHKEVERQMQQRENELTHALYGGLEKIRNERALKVQKGYAKAQFNQQSKSKGMQT